MNGLPLFRAMYSTVYKESMQILVPQKGVGPYTMQMQAKGTFKLESNEWNKRGRRRKTSEM